MQIYFAKIKIYVTFIQTKESENDNNNNNMPLYGLNNLSMETHLSNR